jgi:hypothetical protein
MLTPAAKLDGDIDSIIWSPVKVGLEAESGIPGAWFLCAKRLVVEPATSIVSNTRKTVAWNKRILKVLSSLNCTARIRTANPVRDDSKLVALYAWVDLAVPP